MKRIFTLLFSLVLMSSQAQNKFDVLFSENFDGGSLPAGWEVHDLDGLTPNANVGAITEAWTILQEGATDFALYSTSWYATPGISDDWVTTSAIDLTGVTADDYELVALAFTTSALNEQFADGYEVYINTVGQELENFTPETIVLTVPEENAFETTRTIDLSAYVGQSIYVAYRNNSNDKLALTLDDIQIIGVSGYRADVSDVSYRVYNEVGSTMVNLTGVNRSAVPAQNVTVEYTIDGGVPNSEIVSVGNIATLGAINFDFPVPVADAGAKTISASLTQINGNDLMDVASVSFEASFIDDANKTPRKALIETFTSSTCPPCLPGNENLHGILDNISEDDKPVVIKFQQDFPGAGDGYATTEAISRRGIYNINGIPNTNINGHDFDNNTNALTATNVATSDDRSAFFNIEAEYFVNPSSKTVYIKGTYTPLSAVVSNTRLMIAIQENMTVNNVSSNGETEFLDVFKKFVPGADGLAIPAGSEIGTAVDFEYSYEFQGEYRDPADASAMINHNFEHSVEEFEDLSVSVWVESTDDFNVLNATTAQENEAVGIEDIASINNLTIYPNPVHTDLNIVIDASAQSDAMFTIIDNSGKLIRTLKNTKLNVGKQNVTFDLQGLQSGTYYLQVANDEGAVFTPFIKL